MRHLVSRLFADEWRKLALASEEFRPVFQAAKERALPADLPWYPYDSLSNFSHLDRLLTPRDAKPVVPALEAMAGGKPMLDIGCADGASAFLLASLGFDVDAVDFEPTNFNGMRGIRALNEVVERRIQIHSVDLDSQFRLPREHYGFTFFLGILYHLKNPYYILEQLAAHTNYCFLSTRVTKLDGTRQVTMEQIPAAYLVAPQETNNDGSNFWIFTRAGLLRILDRTGWEVLRYMHTGNTTDSDPATAAGDERAFCLLRSRRSA